MAVPRRNQLTHGTPVHIVLKADQPTGKITTGNIADFLTRGDHPRGIKVRLSDGNIGRVRSIASGVHASAQGSPDENIPLETVRNSPVAGCGIQQDYRSEEQPEEEASLLDYIKVKPKKASKAKLKVTAGSIEAESHEKAPDSEAVSLQQQQMESDFPDLDPSLIAAIMSDHGSPEAARGVLAGLS